LKQGTSPKIHLLPLP